MQKIRVSVVLADRKSRRLIFSVKPKEKEELIEKKRNLMVRSFIILNLWWMLLANPVGNVILLK